MHLKFLIKLILIFLFVIINPIVTFSAEILQVKDPTTILIGDQNRNLVVHLYCVQIDEKNELNALDLLKKNFPRGTSVKIKPYGLNDENLIAKVYKLKEDIEMSELLQSYNLAKDSCN